MTFTSNSSVERFRIMRAIAAGVGLLAAAAAASAQPQFQVSGFTVNSDGRQPPSTWMIYNGVISYTYSGTNMPIGDITIQGNVTSNLALTWASELRYSVYNLTTGASYHSYNVDNGQAWSGTKFIGLPNNPTMVVQDASSLGTVHTGDSLQIRLYESFDHINGGPPTDAIWQSVHLTFHRRQPTGGDLGYATAVPAGLSFLLDTIGSDYDTVAALYDGGGILLQTDDDGGDPVTGSSALNLGGLAAGEYFVAIIGQGGAFADGFDATGGSAGGNLLLNFDGVAAQERTHPDSVAWYRLELRDPACADVNGDNVVTLTDLAEVLAQFGATCP